MSEHEHTVRVPARRGRAVRGRTLAAAAVLAGIASVCLLAPPGAVAAELNLTGVWSANYHCEVGSCAGYDYPAKDILRQAVGSDTVTGHNSAETLSGTLTGNTLVLHSHDLGYEAEGTEIISADGRSWSGPEHDNHSTSGTYTATLEPVVPGSLSSLASPDDCVGEIFEMHSEGAACGTLVPFGLNSAFQIVVSPDGRNAYSVASGEQGGVIEYERDQATGALAVIGCLTARNAECASGNVQKEVEVLQNPSAIAISPNGKHVYVTAVGHETVVALERNQSTGLLTLMPGEHGCVTREPSGVCAEKGDAGIFEPYGVAVSPDETNLYVTSGPGEAVAEFEVEASGEIQPLSGHDCIGSATSGCPDDSAIGMFEPIGIVVSPDGENVYVAAGAETSNGAIVAFKRNGGGVLEQLPGKEGCISEENTECEHGNAVQGSEDITITPDGKNVYATSYLENAVIELERSEMTGALKQLSGNNGCITTGSLPECTAVKGIGAPRGVAVSPGGEDVYVSSSSEDAAAAFARNSEGALEQLAEPYECVTSSSGVCGEGATALLGLGGARRLTVSPDGTNVYVAGQSADAIAELRRAVVPAVSNLAQTSGSEDGGATVAVEGSGFIAGSTVKFGDKPALHVEVMSASSILAVSPEGTGTVAVTVTTPSGTSATSEADEFTYLPPGEVGGIEYSYEYCEGLGYHGDPGDEIGPVALHRGEISGPGWAYENWACVEEDTNEVLWTVGGAAPSEDGACQVEYPYRDTYAIPKNPNNAYSWACFDDPTVTKVEAGEGPLGGGTTVEITGTNFSRISTVKFGAASAGSVKFNSHTSLTAISPAGTGTVDVRVTNYTGASPANPGDRFTYVAPPPTGVISVVSHAPGPELPPAPVLGHTGNVAPVSGTVLVELPGTHTFVPLSSLSQVPFGTVIDATNGRVSVTVATSHGPETGEFFDGEFVLTQGSNGMVLAALTGGNFAVCPTARQRSHIARARASHATGKHIVRKLWADAHGQFSTKGNYAAGAVEGTEWLTEDLCEGTLIRVTRDKVLVTNLVNHHHAMVHTGHHYLAKAP